MNEKPKIIVTGCSGQLGSRLVHDLIELGHYVIGVDVVAPEPQSWSDDFEFHSIDIRDKDMVEVLFQELKSKHVVVNGLVNNAGTAVFSKFEDRTVQELLQVIQLNIMAPIFMVQGFLTVAGQSYTSSIVNVASIYGIVAPDQSIYHDTPRNSSEIYGMSKAAIENLTKYLAVYLAERKIRSNCVSPGGIEFQQGPKFKEAYTAKVPMGRMAKVNEISSTICFLLDEKRASYINGANIVVDGGFTSWR